MPLLNSNKALSKDTWLLVVTNEEQIQIVSRFAKNAVDYIKLRIPNELFLNKYPLKL